MSARITQNMISRSLLLDLQNVTDKLVAHAAARSRRARSSPRRRTTRSRPARRSCSAPTSRSNQQYQRNVAEAQRRGRASPTPRSANVGDVVLRARDLVVQGANDTLGPQGAPGDRQRDDAADRLGQVRRPTRSTPAATSSPGSATLTQPYQLGADDAYARQHRGRQARDRAGRPDRPEHHRPVDVLGDDTERAPEDAARHRRPISTPATRPRSATPTCRRSTSAHDTVVNARAGRRRAREPARHRA